MHVISFRPPSQDPRASEPLGGRGRAALTSADDYADLMEQTVRELRYAPIDREYSAQILARCARSTWIYLDLVDAWLCSVPLNGPCLYAWLVKV